MSWNFERIAIVGAGAIGLYYGGRLAKTGNDVRFLARSDHETLLKQGLKVSSVYGDFSLPTVQSFDSPEALGPVDLVIVTWKATANDALHAVLPPLLHAETQVLTLQNGLGNCETIAGIVGSDRVLGGLCFVGINRTAPAVVDHSGGGRVTIGEFIPDARNRAETIVQRFCAAEIKARAVPDLAVAQWQKLIWNIPFNGLAIAEGGVTTDVLLKDPSSMATIRALMGEVIKAARALGHELPDSLIEANINDTIPMGDYRPSSMIDYVEGRDVELAAIWEEPLRRAEMAGVAMPQTRELLQQIKKRLAERA